MSNELVDDTLDDGLSNRMWPLDVALGALGAFSFVFVARNLSFNDERWLYNGWTYVIGILAGVLALDVILRKIAGRFVQRSMQLGFLVSILIHLSLLTMALNVVLFTQSWPVAQTGKREPPRPVRRVAPEHLFESSAKAIEQRERQKADWQSPTESSNQSRETSDPDRQVRPSPETVPPLEAPPAPQIEMKPPEAELAPKKELRAPDPTPESEGIKLNRQSIETPTVQPEVARVAAPELAPQETPEARAQVRDSDVAAKSAAQPVPMETRSAVASPQLQPQVSATNLAPAAPLPGDKQQPRVAAIDRPLERRESSAGGAAPGTKVRLPEPPSLRTLGGMEGTQPTPALRESRTGRYAPSAGADVPMASTPSGIAAAPSLATGIGGDAAGATGEYVSGAPGLAGGGGPVVADAPAGSPFAGRSGRGNLGSANTAPVTSAVPVVPIPQGGIADSQGDAPTGIAATIPSQGRTFGATSGVPGGGSTPALSGPAELSSTGIAGTGLPGMSGRSQSPGIGDTPNPLAIARSESIQRRSFDSPNPSGGKSPKAAIPFQRRLLRTAGGGSLSDPGQAGPQTEAAIELGLRYMASQQNADGSWSLQAVDPAVQLWSDTAATGLCVLAFQGAGYTHQQHQYAGNVNRAIEWLITHQKEDGDLYRPENDASNRNVWLYSHGVAALALCEAYGMTQDPRLKEPAQKCLDFIAKAQHPVRGGWRYQPQESSDTSVSGWMVMALKSGELAGLQVQPETYDGVRRWLELSRAAGNQPYLFRYNPYALDSPEQRHGREVSPSMTSVGLLMQMYLGWRRDNPQLRQGADYLLQNTPGSGGPQRQRDSYYWYYATQVMFHMGGEHWEKWNRQLNPLLINTQVKSGPATGSWDPQKPVPDRWGTHAGRLYVTAMHLLNLEIYYRHLPIYEETAK